jgi:hypothetical protein
MMTTDKTTDYAEGDDPVPVGTTVEYFGSLSPGRYTVTAHTEPTAHPFQPQEALEGAYPDGVAYELWPVGVPHKLGNIHLSANFVRRTSFRVDPTKDGKK